jgi:hypothetical protein
VQRAFGIGHCGLRLLELLGLELAIDLTLPKIPDERTGFTREPLRFLLKRADSIRDTLRVTALLCPDNQRRKDGYEQEQR